MLVQVAGVAVAVATGGVGRYLGSIDWLTWGTAGGVVLDQTPATGPPITTATSMSTRTIAGQVLVTTCTLSNHMALAGGADAITAYIPGSFAGDALDDMYNIGGPDGANTFVNGLRTGPGIQSFDVSCSTTLDGAPVPMAGLVFADAEQSVSVGSEYVQGSGVGTWRIIDYFRTPTCMFSSAGTLTSPNTLRLAGAGQCGEGPAAVAFLEAPTPAPTLSLTAELRGGGASAIALGVVLPTDFGDAPASYGTAGSLYSPGFTGGVVPSGGPTPIPGTAFDDDNELGVPAQPVTRLGARVDSEVAAQPGVLATGDDLNGALSDEDALSAAPSPVVEPGGNYSLPGVACTGPGAVSGWIDWNGNGVFDLVERSAQVDCMSSPVTLTWVVPADVKAAQGSTKSYLRLRIAPTADPRVAAPTGLSTAGEVEDYAVNIAVAIDLSMRKSVSPPAVAPGGMLTYTVTVRNNSAGPSSGFTVNDTVPAGVTALATSTPGCSFVGNALTCVEGALATGASFVITYTGTAPASGTVMNTATVTGNENDPSPSNNTSTTTTTVTGGGGGTPPAVADVSVVSTGPPSVTSGGQITWNLTARNNGPDTATGTVLSVTVPAGVTNVALLSAVPGCALAGSTLTCTLNPIANGATVMIGLTGTVSAPAGSTLTTTASVITPNDPTPGNNSATSTTSVTPSAPGGPGGPGTPPGTPPGGPVVGPGPDLSVSKSATGIVRPGGTVTWTVTVRNAGPGSSTGYTVTDALPPGVSRFATSTPGCSISGSSLRCVGGVLAPGASAVIRFTGTVADSAALSSLDSVATVVGLQPDPVPGNNTARSTSTVCGVGDPGDFLFTLGDSRTLPKIGGGTVQVRIEDVVRYSKSANAYELVFDGSDVGLAKLALQSFALDPKTCALIGSLYQTRDPARCGEDR